MKDMQGRYYVDPACLEVPHKYAHPNLHILADLALYNILARMCALGRVPHPLFRQYLQMIYHAYMGHVLARELPTQWNKMSTRMWDVLEKDGKDPDPGMIDSQAFFNASIRVVSVGIARAGTMAAEACHDATCAMLGWDLPVQDAMSGERKPAANGPGVDGCTVSGIKIGANSVDDALVAFPDPMCATAGSLVANIRAYREKALAEGIGTPWKVVAMPLIITPEAVQRLAIELPDVPVYALRLDRGNSSARALDSVPGTYPEEESGLTETDYIVPGGGGFGELLSNADH